MTEIRFVDDLAEFVSLVDLTDIAPVEVRAARLTGTVLPSEAELEAGNQIYRRIDDNSVEIRIVSTVVSEEARLTVDVLVRYEKLEPFDCSDLVLQEFTQRIGLLAGYPYVRETIADLSMRLRIPPVTLGIMRSGDIQFTPLSSADTKETP